MAISDYLAEIFGVGPKSVEEIVPNLESAISTIRRARNNEPVDPDELRKARLIVGWSQKRAANEAARIEEPTRLEEFGQRAAEVGGFVAPMLPLAAAAAANPAMVAASPWLLSGGLADAAMLGLPTSQAAGNAWKRLIGLEGQQRDEVTPEAMLKTGAEFGAATMPAVNPLLWATKLGTRLKMSAEALPAIKEGLEPLAKAGSQALRGKFGEALESTKDTLTKAPTSLVGLSFVLGMNMPYLKTALNKGAPIEVKPGVFVPTKNKNVAQIMMDTEKVKAIDPSSLSQDDQIKYYANYTKLSAPEIEAKVKGIEQRGGGFIEEPTSPALTAVQGEILKRQDPTLKESELSPKSSSERIKDAMSEKLDSDLKPSIPGIVARVTDKVLAMGEAVSGGLVKSINPWISSTMDSIGTVLEQGVSELKKRGGDKQSIAMSEKMLDDYKELAGASVTSDQKITSQLRKYGVEEARKALPEDDLAIVRAGDFLNAPGGWRKAGLNHVQKNYLMRLEKATQFFSDLKTEAVEGYTERSGYVRQMLKKDIAKPDPSVKLDSTEEKKVNLGIKHALGIIENEHPAMEPKPTDFTHLHNIYDPVYKEFKGKYSKLNQVVYRLQKAQDDILNSNRTLYDEDPLEYKKSVDGIISRLVDSEYLREPDLQESWRKLPSVDQAIGSTKQRWLTGGYGESAEINGDILYRKMKDEAHFETSQKKLVDFVSDMAGIAKMDVIGEKMQPSPESITRKGLTQSLLGPQYTTFTKWVDNAITKDWATKTELTHRPNYLSWAVDKIKGTETSKERYPTLSATREVVDNIYKNLLSNPRFWLINSGDSFVKVAMNSEGPIDMGKKIFRNVENLSYLLGKDVGKGGLNIPSLKPTPFSDFVDKHTPVSLHSLSGIGYDANVDAGIVARLARKVPILGKKAYNAGGLLWKKWTDVTPWMERLSAKAIYIDAFESVLKKKLPAAQVQELSKMKGGLAQAAIEKIPTTELERYAKLASYETANILALKTGTFGKAPSITPGKDSVAKSALYLASIFTTWPKGMANVLAKATLKMTQQARLDLSLGKTDSASALMQMATPTGVVVLGSLGALYANQKIKGRSQGSKTEKVLHEVIAIPGSFIVGVVKDIGDSLVDLSQGKVGNAMNRTLSLALSGKHATEATSQFMQFLGGK